MGVFLMIGPGTTTIHHPICNPECPPDKAPVPGPLGILTVAAMMVVSASNRGGARAREPTRAAGVLNAAHSHELLC